MFSGYGSVIHGPAHDHNDLGESVSDQRPDSRSLRLNAQIGTRHFHDLQNIKLESIKKRDCTNISSTKFSEYFDNLINASTGAGTSGESNAAPQTITGRNISPSTVSPDIETFITIIESLKTLNRDWSVTSLLIGHGHQDANNWWHSYFPEVLCRKKTKIPLQFSFLDKKKLVPKVFIAVEININNQYLYLFEAQRRLKETMDDNKKSSPYKENMSILLLYKSGYPQCTGQDFTNMIKKTVVNKTWPNKAQLPDFTRDYTVHGHGAQTTDILASRITDLINKNINLEV